MSPAPRQEIPSKCAEKPRAVPPHDSLKDAEPGSSFLRPSTERRRPSLSEFAEQFESAINEKQDLASRLSKLVDDITAMTRLHEQAHAEFDCERTQLNSEITNLRAQLTGLSNRSENRTSDDSRLQSLLAARERLIRDEFERKFRELTVQVKQERSRYAQAVQKVQKQLSSCICRASG